MSNKALEYKNLGNEALKKGQFDEAINLYTKGLEIEPENDTLLSNRSAAYTRIEKYEEALKDAEKLVKLRPDWAKSYLRLGAALHGLNRLEEASKTYSKGLELEPNNPQLKKLFNDVEQLLKQRRGKEDFPHFYDGIYSNIGKEDLFGEGGLGNIFSSPEIWAKIAGNPALSKYLADEDFVNKVKELQQNPGKIQEYLKDQRILQLFGLLIGANVQMADDTDDFPKEEPKKEEPKKEEPKKEEPKKEEDVEMEEEKSEAELEKEKGNEFYKKKQFDKAMEHYNKAIELEPENIVYYLNRAAVYLETKRYDECIKECEEALKIGKKNFADFKLIARGYGRMGTAYERKGDLDKAIYYYKESLTEHRTADILNKLNAAEREKKRREELAYIDPKISLEEREKGNECFRKQKYPEAIGHYREAIKRNPKDHVLYSNLAASYMKMGEFRMALKEIEKCLSLEPKFVKAYALKGQCHFFCKEYHKALDAFGRGLELDSTNRACEEGYKRVIEAINSEQPDEERLRRAQEDPEIQAILLDPVMQTVLNDIKNNPAAAAHHLQNAEIKRKIEKLIAAGIIQTR